MPINYYGSNAKDNALMCIRVCGAITGYHMNLLCPDPEIIKEMMLNFEVRKIAVGLQVKTIENKPIPGRVMFLYQEMHKHKTVDFPYLVESDAQRIHIMNSCYCKYNDHDVSWFSPDEIQILNTGENPRFTPDLMFISGSELVGVFINKKDAAFTPQEKDALSEKHGLQRIIEYTY